MFWLLNSKATIVFPSTHVVFEGLKEQKENLDENHPANTFLEYVQVKFKNEKQVMNSEKNMQSLDLVLLYGFSTDTMRINTMSANLFSKIASQKMERLSYLVVDLNLNHWFL